MFARGFVRVAVYGMKSQGGELCTIILKWFDGFVDMLENMFAI